MKLARWQKYEVRCDKANSVDQIFCQGRFFFVWSMHFDQNKAVEMKIKKKKGMHLFAFPVPRVERNRRGGIRMNVIERVVVAVVLTFTLE